jgi:hypothetical protein
MVKRPIPNKPTFASFVFNETKNQSSLVLNRLKRLSRYLFTPLTAIFVHFPSLGCTPTLRFTLATVFLCGCSLAVRLYLPALAPKLAEVFAHFLSEFHANTLARSQAACLINSAYSKAAWYQNN